MVSRSMRLGALALATLFGVSLAFAQAPKPAAPGAAGPAPQPIKLDLIPLQAPWTKVCQKDPNGAKEFCRTIRAFGQAADQPPTLAMAVDTLTGEDKKVIRMQLPEGLLLRPGFRLVVDRNDPVDGRYSICAGGSCFAEAEINNAGLNQLKKAPDRRRRGAQPGRRRSHVQRADARLRRPPSMVPRSIRRRSKSRTRRCRINSRRRPRSSASRSRRAPPRPRRPRPRPPRRLRRLPRKSKTRSVGLPADVRAQIDVGLEADAPFLAAQFAVFALRR